MNGLPSGFAPNRIILLKPCCIGDVLMTTPLARSLKAAWPAATIDWAVGDHSRAVLDGNPDVHALLDASGTMRGDLSPRAIVRLILALRRGRYDAAFIAERSPLPAAIARLAGIPVRVGLDSGGRGRLHTVRVPARPDDPRHETDIYLDLARAVGAPAADPRPVFVPSTADVEAARAVVEAVETARGGPLPRPWLIVHPGGGQNPGAEHLAKRWRAARFAVIAARVAARLGGSAILVGGPDDVRLGGDVVAGALANLAVVGRDGPDEPDGHDELGGRDRVVDVTGRLSLGATAALIARADAYVGNDSGVAHLAAAVGTPVVAIFGPTSAARYGPVRGAGEAVTAGAASTRGGAIEAVDVAAVWGAVGRALGVGRAGEAGA